MKQSPTLNKETGNRKFIMAAAEQTDMSLLPTLVSAILELPLPVAFVGVGVSFFELLETLNGGPS